MPPGYDVLPGAARARAKACSRERIVKCCTVCTIVYALAVAFGFMLGAFGQIPINDYMIGKTASGAFRARIYGVRYVVSFTVLAASLPMIAFVYDNWGFDTLFWILAAASIVIMCAVLSLPKQLPQLDPAPAE